MCSTRNALSHAAAREDKTPSGMCSRHRIAVTTASSPSPRTLAPKPLTVGLETLRCHEELLPREACALPATRTCGQDHTKMRNLQALCVHSDHLCASSSIEPHVRQGEARRNRSVKAAPQARLSQHPPPRRERGRAATPTLKIDSRTGPILPGRSSFLSTCRTHAIDPPRDTSTDRDQPHGLHATIPADGSPRAIQHILVCTT